VAAAVSVRVLERVARSSRPGVLLRLLLRPFRRRPRPSAAPGYQYSFPFFLPAPTEGLLLETDQVRCDFFDCTLPARECLKRQAAKWPGRNRMKDGSTIARRAGLDEYCASGLCEQGKGYRERLPGYIPPAFRFYRPGSHEQRVARRKWIRSNLDVVPDMDHPPGSSETKLESLGLPDPDLGIPLVT
jgi:hypothetical protein